MRKWKDVPLSIVVLICGTGLGIIFCCSDGGVEIGIALISISVGIFLLSLFWYLYKNKCSLRPELQTVYNRIVSTLAPYKNIENIKRAESSAKALLQSLSKEYIDFGRQGTLKDNDVSKIIMETRNSEVRDIFGYLFIVYYIRTVTRGHINISPTEEERTAIRALEQFCDKKISNRVEDVPEPFWEYFEINKYNYQKKRDIK